jgi:hypothetical protein
MFSMCCAQADVSLLYFITRIHAIKYNKDTLPCLTCVLQGTVPCSTQVRQGDRSKHDTENMYGTKIPVT